MYSFHTRKRSRFGQRHSVQKLTLTSYFYKKYLSQIKVIYFYFYESIFKTNLFICFLYFETQQFKSYSWFIFPMFDPNFVQNDILFGYGGSNYRLWPNTSLSLGCVSWSFLNNGREQNLLRFAIPETQTTRCLGGVA